MFIKKLFSNLFSKIPYLIVIYKLFKCIMVKVKSNLLKNVLFQFKKHLNDMEYHCLFSELKLKPN